jgi:hypothetical protein
MATPPTMHIRRRRCVTKCTTLSFSRNCALLHLLLHCVLLRLHCALSSNSLLLHCVLLRLRGTLPCHGLLMSLNCWRTLNIRRDHFRPVHLRCHSIMLLPLVES